MHEWVETFERSLTTTEKTTWVFDADSFVPSAKLVGDKSYSIVSDYLGTPCQAYSENGAKVWEYEQKSYGGVESLQGAINFVPFRYQGQYEDVETGLYYNRFRYYSPDEESYISQDPIRLEGGFELYNYVHDTNEWLDPFGLASCGTPTLGKKSTKSVKSGADAPKGAGVYSFKDINGNKYSGSTNDFQSRMNNHIADGRLSPGTKVEFTPVNAGVGRTDQGARRVRRFFEQQKIGVDSNGVPKANASSKTRAVTPEKWKKYTTNGNINFNDPYFN